MIGWALCALGRHDWSPWMPRAVGEVRVCERRRCRGRTWQARP